MDNPETLATLGTQVTGQRVEKTKETIENGQPLGCPFFIVSLVFSTLCPVSYVLNVASVSGLSILDCPFGLLYPLSRVLCTQCCQCLWVVHS
jgi:hypothetical protein